jgi:hypothetical protein
MLVEPNGTSLSFTGGPHALAPTGERGGGAVISLPLQLPHALASRASTSIANGY